MGLVNNLIRKKKIKALKARNLITNDWSDFVKNYPLITAKLNDNKHEDIKNFTRPSTKIKIYFNSNNVTFYMIGVSGNEEKIPNNVIFNSWDEVTMEELNELLK